MTKDFAAIILSHGRADRVVTYDTLKKQGYTGRIVILIDNHDKTADKYREKFGDQVVVFDKNKTKQWCDTANNFGDFRSTIFARNAMFQVAKDLKLKSFIQLDDDYTAFRYKFNSDFKYINDSMKRVWSLDKMFEVLSNFVLTTPVTSLCFAQGGDFIGGENSALATHVRTKRKGMNSFVCATNKPFMCLGQMNEDVNTAVSLGSRGQIFLMTNQVALEQIQTQSNAGGMTEIYKDSGTYCKTFYSIMYHPSSVKIHYLNTANKRVHHQVTWKYTVPKILREDVRSPIVAVPEETKTIDSRIDANEHQIPKRFMRIWLGPKKIPEVFDLWWKEFQELHPDYDFITFTDNNLKQHGVNIPDSIANCYKNVGTYAGRSDILRILLLKQFGGIYVDTDVMPIRSFSPLIENKTTPFIAKRSSKSFESAIIASPKNHPALDILISKLPKWFAEHKDRSASVQTGPAFISNFWFGRKDVEHLPTKTFYPFNGFMAPKRDEKEKMFADKSKFPKTMYAAHFSNHQWGGKPKS